MGATERRVLPGRDDVRPRHCRDRGRSDAARRVRFRREAAVAREAPAHGGARARLRSQSPPVGSLAGAAADRAGRQEPRDARAARAGSADRSASDAGADRRRAGLGARIFRPLHSFVEPAVGRAVRAAGRHGRQRRRRSSGAAWNRRRQAAFTPVCSSRPPAACCSSTASRICRSGAGTAGRCARSADVHARRRRHAGEVERPHHRVGDFALPQRRGHLGRASRAAVALERDHVAGAAAARVRAGRAGPAALLRRSAGRRAAPAVPPLRRGRAEPAPQLSMARQRARAAATWCSGC